MLPLHIPFTSLVFSSTTSKLCSSTSSPTKGSYESSSVTMSNAMALACKLSRTVSTRCEKAVQIKAASIWLALRLDQKGPLQSKSMAGRESTDATSSSMIQEYQMQRNKLVWILPLAGINLSTLSLWKNLQPPPKTFSFSVMCFIGGEGGTYSGRDYHLDTSCYISLAM